MRHQKPKHVHAYTDRQGRQRIYLRKPGEKRVPLPGPLYSPAFWTAYHAGLASQPVATPDRNPAGSVSAAIMGYYGSAEYKHLADSTRANYRRMLERFRAEHGTKPLARLETRHINAIIDAKADTPAAANGLRKRLHTVLEYAIGAGLLTENPIKRAKIVKYNEQSYRSWTEEDISAYRARWPEGTPQRLALELLLYTGLRRSDVVRVGWKHIRDGAIHITTQKSQHKSELHIPIHAELWRHLQPCPRKASTFLATTWGKDRSAKGSTNWVREAAHAAGLPSDSSPHGLRHAACRRLAEAGCTPHQIQAITGHKNLQEVETYTKAVDQLRLAESAIAKLANPSTGLANLDANQLEILRNLSVVALPSGIEPLSPP